MIPYRNGGYGPTRTELDSSPGIHRDICNQPRYQVPGALIGIRLLYFPVSCMYLMWCSMFMFGGVVVAICVWDKFKKTYILYTSNDHEIDDDPVPILSKQKC